MGLNYLADGLRALYPDQLLVQPAVEIGEPVGVHSQLVQDGGMQVLDVVGVLNSGASQLIRGAHALSALNAAPSHPHGKPEGVMVATGAFFILCGRLPPELATPDNK